MRKICHITSRHDSFDTRIFYKECRTLKNKYSVVLLAPNASSAMNDGIEITGFQYTAGKNISNLFRILRTALKQKAELYHIHDPELLPVAWLLRTFFGKKIIYDVHENYYESLIEHQASKLTQRLFRFFDRWAAKNCALILAESSYISIYQGRARNLSVIENFCDVAALKPYLSFNRTNSNRMVYIGTIHEHRGAIVMLEVLNNLRARGLDIKLDMIGKITDPGLMKRIEALPFYSKIKNEISWHGPLNISESYHIAEKSFVGLCLIEPLPNHLESYPTKLFEYMAVGLPIVATNISLYRSVVERRECGLCAAYDDIPAIADIIGKIYTDKALLQSFSERGPQVVISNYNWASEKNILLDFYQKVLPS